MKKILLSVAVFVAIAAVIVALLAASRVELLKFLLEFSIGHEFGARVTIDEIFLDGKNHILRMKNFTVYNPEGFNREHALAYLPEIVARYNAKSLIERRKLHVEELEVNMKLLNVVKNADGKMNVNALKISLENLDILPLEFDRLILNVDEVVYKDYTKGPKPKVEAYKVNIRAKSFADIPTVDAVVTKIIMESLSKTAIEGVAIVGLATIAAGTVAGPVIVPVGVAAIVLSAKDSYSVTIDEPYDKVYNAALRAAQELGDKISEDKSRGAISGNIDGANVTIKISEQGKKETQLRVSARGLLMAKPRIAAGVLCEIYQNLKPPKSKK